MYMYKKTLILSITIAFLSQGWAYAANEEIPIIDLGTAKTDNSGYSSASGISADGSVAIGVAETNSGDQQAFRYNVADASMVALGTLKADNSGYSQANAISANGDVVVGLAETDTASQQAFRHNKGDAKMTGLGTLKTDNSGYSTARAVSTDGQMVVGAAETDAGTRQAFRHNQGDAKMTGLGTLKADNSGSSNALDVSADGRVVVGDSSTDIGNTQAFRHNNGDAKMTALGTLVTDNSGYSSALAVSASGRVTVGVAETDSQDWQAFRHNEGDTKMTGLGTLKSDNSGFSIANAVSADGLVVVGDAEIDAGNTQAFRHNEGDIKMTGLGTLTTDNSGNSSALAVSADGRVVVGNATTDSGDIHAFRHNEGDAKMTDLGTLKTDNSGTSTASAVSADGSLVVGVSDNDFGQQRAVIWKTTKAIDIENNYAGMNKTASKAAEILDLYQNTLLTLADSRCQLGESNYCLGAFTQYNNVHRGSNFAGGLYGAIRLPSENWTIGGSINLRSDTDLVKNYNAHGNTFPGIGLFTRYQANKDNSGFTIELAGSYIKQNLSISRERLNGGEAGKGNSSIKGYMGKMTAGYGFNLLPQTQLTPLIGIQYSKVSRDGYTENSNADFLAHYNKLSNKTTDLQLGLNLKQQVSKIVSLEAEIGERINLKSQRNDFKASMDYFGTQNYQRMKAQHTKPYARLGTNIAVTKNSTISTNVGWSETDYRKDASFVGVGYSYHW